MDRKALINCVNLAVRVEDLLFKFYDIKARPGFTLHCPFHSDSRKSAKFYSDNAIYCFAESKMYRPYDIFKLNGFSDVELAKEFGHVDFKTEEPKRILTEDYWSLRNKYRGKKLVLQELLKDWLALR